MCVEADGGGYSVYYFAAVILQFYVLLPLFQKYRILRNVPAMAVVTLLWVAGYIYIVYPEYPQLPLVAYGGVILCWLVYFALGAAFMKDGIKSRVSVLLCLAGSIAALALCCAECIFLREKPDALPFDGTGLKPSAVLFAVCICALLYSDRCAKVYRSGVAPRFICRLGRFSYGMYLAHMYALWLGGKILAFTGFGFPGIKLFWWAAYTAVVVGTTFCILSFANRISLKLSKVFLGI